MPVLDHAPAHMAFLLSIAPILLILGLMAGWRWSAARAGGAGYLLTVLIAVTAFGAGGDLLAYAHAKAFFLSLDVLLIIWAAFLLFRVADEAGAIATIGQALQRLTDNRGLQALIIGWVFASFLQGVGGFGVPVAVTSPLLVGLGFSPLTAVLLPSLGHGWAVTFGSLGSSFQALIAASGMAGESLAPLSALFLGAAGIMSGGMVAYGAVGGREAMKLTRGVVILGLAMGAVQYLAAVNGFWNIGSFAGSLAGLAICPWLARRSRPEEGAYPALDRRELAVALSAYAILVVIILGMQALPGLKAVLSRVAVQAQFPQVSTQGGWLGLPAYITPAGLGRKIPLLAHSASQLVLAALLGYLILRRARRYQAGALGRILSSLLRGVLPASVSIFSMVTMAVVMEHAGMTEMLARGLVEGVGSAFPLVSPWIGAIGAFITGSNTNANMVFAGLQRHTAQLLGLPSGVILAAQTAGAGLASMMAPTKVAVGASTAGMAGREGEVLRQLLGYVTLLVLFISMMTCLAVWIS